MYLRIPLMFAVYRSGSVLRLMTCFGLICSMVNVTNDVNFHFSLLDYNLVSPSIVNVC